MEKIIKKVTPASSPQHEPAINIGTIWQSQHQVFIGNMKQETLVFPVIDSQILFCSGNGRDNPASRRLQIIFIRRKVRVRISIITFRY